MADLLEQEKLGARVPHFRGNEGEWFDWRSKILAYLDQMGLLDTLLAERPAEGAGRADWDKKNRQIYNRLVLHTHGAPLSLVQQFEEPRETGQQMMDGVGAWKDLVDKYEPKGTMGKVALWAELNSSALGDTQDPDLYFVKVESLQRRLKGMGQDISDETLMGNIVSKLPSTYSDLAIILRYDDKLTYMELKKKVRVHYHGQIKNAGEEREKALMGEFRGSCHGCGEYGHSQLYCPKSRGSSTGAGAGGGRGAAAQGGRGGGRGGGRSSGWRGGRGGRGARKPRQFKGNCFLCNKQGHMVGDCPMRPKAVDSANTAMEDEDERDWTFVAEDPGADDQGAWIVDSGCTTHVTSSAELLTNVQKYSGEIVIGDGRSLKAVGRGELRTRVKCDDGGYVNITLKDVVVAPQMGRNLLSVLKMAESGAEVRFARTGATIERGGVRVPLRRSGKLYLLDLLEPVAGGSEQGHKEQAHVATEANLWHRRLGHRNYADIKRLGELGVGVPKGLSGEGKCDMCEMGKHTHHSFPRSAERRAKEPFEVVHTDLLGPMEETSVGGARWAILFTCEFSGWRMMYPMSTKGQALDKLKLFEQDVSGLRRGARPKEINIWGLQSDNGSEFTSAAFKSHCKERGILQTFSGVEAPQQNGIAERSWRTVVEMARCMRLQAGLPKTLWAEAANTAVYLINRLPSRAQQGDTPYHKLFGRHADLSHLRVWGCKVYV